MLVPHGMNAIVFGEELRGRGQKSTAYSEGYLIRRETMIYCDNMVINLSCKVIACGIILSSVKFEKRFSIVKMTSE